MRAVVFFLVGWPLAACGGQVVAIKMPESDPNASGHYTCTPAGKSGFECHSLYTFHQYDREVEVKKEHCAYGVSRVYVETDWRGNVTRVQYTCGTLPSGNFPTEDEANPCPPPTPH
jgi:hypothetical protein